MGVLGVPPIKFSLDVIKTLPVQHEQISPQSGLAFGAEWLYSNNPPGQGLARRVCKREAQNNQCGKSVVKALQRGLYSA